METNLRLNSFTNACQRIKKTRTSCDPKTIGSKLNYNQIINMWSKVDFFFHRKSPNSEEQRRFSKNHHEKLKEKHQDKSRTHTQQWSSDAYNSFSMHIKIQSSIKQNSNKLNIKAKWNSIANGHKNTRKMQILSGHPAIRSSIHSSPICEKGAEWNESVHDKNKRPEADKKMT